MCYRVIMTKQKAGERKRTFTITVGPLTEAYLVTMQEELLRLGMGVNIRLTSVAAGALVAGLVMWSKTFDKPLPSGLLTAYD